MLERLHSVKNNAEKYIRLLMLWEYSDTAIEQLLMLTAGMHIC